MVKGGMKFLDLKGVAIDESQGSTIKGVYSQIEGTHQKTVVITGLVIGEKEFNVSLFTNPVVSGTDYVLDIPGFRITIDDDDLVTATKTITIPLPANTGSFILTATNGVIQWTVAESNNLKTVKKIKEKGE